MRVCGAMPSLCSSPVPTRSRRWRSLAALGAAGALGLALHLSCATPASLERRQERLAQSAHWAEGRFENPRDSLPIESKGSGGTFFKFLFVSGEREPEPPLPVTKVLPASLLEPPADSVRVTWFGHSSVLLEIEGRRVLCDPVWSERASPVGIAGPKRFGPPPLELSELPDPDVVVISHDHYDHLDEETVRALSARGARFAVPLGVGARLEDFDLPPERIHELDWWEGLEVVPGELTLVATPARHFSGRGPFDRNRTLWASWVVLGRSKRVFFGGDGGLSDGQSEIGERFGPFDLTMLEIGAYDEAWADIHFGPEKALQAHERLRGEVLMPIHWATFSLALHAWYAPGEGLLEANRMHNARLALPRIGQSFSLDQPLPDEPWWREAMPKAGPSAEGSAFVSPGGDRRRRADPW